MVHGLESTATAAPCGHDQLLAVRGHRSQTCSTRRQRRPGSRAAGLAMAFKLIEAAQTRWRTVNAPHLVALVRAGARFDAGKLIERPDAHPIDTPTEAAA
jgi:hypothetical protein